MVSLKPLAIALAVALCGSSATAAPNNWGNGSSRTPSGEFSRQMKWTWFDGVTACGKNYDRDNVWRNNYVAVKGEAWNWGQNCGATVWIKFKNGEYREATIIDTCQDCDILGSAGLFRAGANVDDGVQYVNWGLKRD